ncbi:MAG: CotH kinase family protein [Ruminococcus sp.]|nr:CotH kinase family protein [Ruminococcus sp.]
MNDLKRRVVSMISAAAMLSASGALPASASLSEAPSAPDAGGSARLFINEVCTGNSGGNGNVTSAVDKKGGFCDWIELYNGGDADADLNGWKLVKDDSTEYAFSGVTVPAGGTLLVFSCKTYNGDASAPNTGYNLSGDGVKLSLMNGEDTVDTAEVPALEEDTTWARQPDGTGDFQLLFPTPGASNNEAESAVPCNEPVFGTESGIYADPFDLSLETDAGNTIYYTTDGTDPATSATRIEYRSPLNIHNRSAEANLISAMVKVSEITPWDGRLPSKSAVDKGTVIRAVTYSAAGKYSETVTKSYFVGVSSKDHNGLPIISVTTDPQDLFGYEKGIFVKGKVFDDNKSKPEYRSLDDGKKPANYNQKGKEWERACHIDFFEADGTLGLSQDCGMRTQGAYSRAAYQKSVRFYAREEYGAKNFKYPLIPNVYAEDGSGRQLKKFKKFVCRAGGNDIDYTKYKDSYIQSLVSDRAIDTQEGRPCVMFIDGEYFGLFTLQEDFDDDYYEENYGVDSDEVVVYKKGEIDEGTEEDIGLFREMREFAENNDLSVRENYDKMCSMIDVQSFIDYMSVEMYIINEDWPGNNYSLWRTRTTDPTNPYSDGRWRFNLYDTEMGVYHYGNASTKPTANNLRNIMSNKRDDMPVLFNAMMKNEEFKARFVNTFMDLTAKNFDPAAVAEKEKPFYKAYYPELSKSFARYPNWANTSNATDPCLARMHEFFNDRPAYVPKMLAADLKLPDAVTVNIDTINPDGGSVRLNTIDIDTAKRFSGSYFPETPITITAEPAEGYSFVGWRGTFSSDEASITVDPAKAAALQAVFVRDGEAGELCKVTFTDGEKSVELYTKKGGSVPFPADCFTREGYKASAENASGVTADTVINVKYTGISYTVRYISNGSKESSYEQKMTYGTEAALDKCRFSREGWIFAGWARTSTASSPDYTDGQKVSDLTAKDGATITMYAVWKRDIAACEISGVAASYVYKGKAVRPIPAVTADGAVLTHGTDFTLSFSNADKCGKASVTITGEGKYSGKTTLTYKIVPAKPTVSVTRAKTSITLKWDKVAGAEKYVIYRKSGSSWKKIKTVTATSFKDKSLKAGTVYRYKAAAVGGGQTGAKAVINTATKTAAPKLTVSSPKKGTAVLKWNKVSKSQGYRILMSTDGKTFKPIKTVGASKTAFTRKSLKSGKTYKFMVQTIIKVDGKKLYSANSKKVKIKVK